MKPIIFISLLLVCLLTGSCAPAQDFDARLESIVEPYLFSIVGWELRTVPHELHQLIFYRQPDIDDEIRVVADYFSFTERINTLNAAIEAANTGSGESNLASLEAELNSLQEQRTALGSKAERILEKQIRDTLAQQGIFNPIVGLGISFPPLNFKTEKPPYVLVISPRDRIESAREVTLQPSLILEEIKDIEARVDELGVSSLVVEIGGLGATYPTLITNEANLRYIIDTATEEWLHQYLVFKPLGFLYLLDLIGLSRNYEIATMNETLASMVSKEIGALVYEEYYSEYEDGFGRKRTAESEFDFNREMREIRRMVDGYLARGEIEQAEEFMEQRRQYLASEGYHIRKLNQAYFAFHGAYADSPTSISPIGVELKKLRAQSASLKDFLNTVAAMSSHQHLKDRVQ